MGRVNRRQHGSVAPAAQERDPDYKPTLGPEYEEWLDRSWDGDTRELREGRFLHQQNDLRHAFETSGYWLDVLRNLHGWGNAYTTKTEALLFQEQARLPELNSKSWQSFLSRTWRENIHRNPNWPNPPENGWWLPNNWFERAWDIVRTRFVVRYIDGVTLLADSLQYLAKRQFHLEIHRENEDKPDGYYAIHLIVKQPFLVDALDYEGKQERKSGIEIQVMTSLAEVISQLTHVYYEDRREADPGELPPAFDWESKESEAEGLWNQSVEVEQKVMRMRTKIRAATTRSGAKRSSSRRPHAK